MDALIREIEDTFGIEEKKSTYNKIFYKGFLGLQLILKNE